MRNHVHQPCLMHLETRCPVCVNDSVGERIDVDGSVLLEGDALIVRGHASTQVARHSITSMSICDGVLTVLYQGGAVQLTLDDAAEGWQEALRAEHRTRAERLGVRSGARVLLIRVNDPTIGRECVEAGAVLVDEHTADVSMPVDIMLTELGTEHDLARISTLATGLGAASLWVIYPNGVPALGDAAIAAVAQRAGLERAETMSFSAGMSAECLRLQHNT